MRLNQEKDDIISPNLYGNTPHSIHLSLSINKYTYIHLSLQGQKDGGDGNDFWDGRAEHLPRLSRHFLREDTHS